MASHRLESGERGGGVDVSAIYSRQDINLTTTSRFDMTPVAAEVMIAQAEADKERARADQNIARSTHEVPAKEQTKRAWIEKGIIGICVLAALVVIYSLKDAEISWAIAAIIGVLGAASFASDVMKKLRGGA